MTRKLIALMFVLASFILVTSCSKATETPTKKVSSGTATSDEAGKPQVLEFYSEW